MTTSLTPAPFTPRSTAAGDAAMLIRRWQLEYWLGWLHTANPPLCLLLLLVSGVSLALALAFTLVLGTRGQIILPVPRGQHGYT